MLHDLFPTPVWISQIPAARLAAVRSEVDRVIDSVAAQPKPWDESGTTSFNWQGCNDLVTYGLTRLCSELESAQREYCRSLGYDHRGIEIVDSWFNWYRDGDFMFEHLHPDRLISGCYYHRTTGLDGVLKLKNPNPLMQFKAWPADQLRDQDWRIQPCEGMIVLFPSWLVHRVSVNSTGSTRVSIALNFARP